MKLVTRFEAASRSTDELHGLLREAFNAFAAAPRGSSAVRNNCAKTALSRSISDVQCEERTPSKALLT